MRRLSRMVLMCACGPAVAMPGDSSHDSTTTGAVDTTASVSVGPSSPGTSPSSTDATAVATTIDPSTTRDDGEGECGGVGIQCPDLGVFDCDLWAQDCPAGQKCMPWTDDGGPRWNATRCSSVAPDPALLGEPCTVVRSATFGIDDCDLGLMCLWTDPLNDIGTCVGTCGGSEENPNCEDPSTTCSITYDGVIQLCLPECDPLAPACPPRAGCFPSGSTFVCGDPIEPPIDLDAACAFPWDCASGSFCIDAAMLPTCDAAACCTSVCDTTLPEPCGPGLTCSPVYDGSIAGYCTTP